MIASVCLSALVCTFNILPLPDLARLGLVLRVLNHLLLMSRIHG